MIVFLLGMLVGAVGGWFVDMFVRYRRVQEVYDMLSEDEDIVSSDAVVIFNEATHELSWAEYVKTIRRQGVNRKEEDDETER